MAGLQGRSLGGYQLVAQLSSGGVAEVYRATPTQPGGREAIVKVIYPEFARQTGFRARFEQIVQVAKRLNHPHILPLLASGEQSGYLYIVTPFVAAGTLKDWITGGRRLGTHDVGPFFRQVCEAVGYAHSQSVVHGNIKPSNIFLFEGRHVLLGDFGRLWDVGQMDMTHAGPGIEAVEFLAPETTEGRTDQRSDIYGLGAVLFASLTGAPPFRGNTPFDVLGQHARKTPPPLASARPPVEPGVVALDPVIQRALAKAPDGRFPSALALAQAVEAAVHGAPAVAAPHVASPLGGIQPTLGKASFPPLPPGLVEPGMEEGGFAVSQPTAPASTALGPGVPTPYQLGGAPSPSARGGPPGATDVFAQLTERVAAQPDLGGFPDLPTRRDLSVPAASGAFGGAIAPAAGGAGNPKGDNYHAGSVGQQPGGSAGLPMPVLPDLPPGLGLFGAADNALDDGRTFSPTRLGLPRLTMNELDGLSPEWQELLSEPMPVIGAGGRDDTGNWGSATGDWGAAADHGNGAGSPLWGETGEDSQAYSAAQPVWSDTDSQQSAVPDVYASSSMAALPSGRNPDRISWQVGPDSQWGQSGVAESDEDQDHGGRSDSFADPTAWARRRMQRRYWNPKDKLPRGREVRFRPKTKARPLMLVLLLLLLLDGGLIAGVRPDLCPGHACDNVHAKLVHYLPVLNTLQTAFIVPITATPDKPVLNVAAGASAALPLKLTNTSHQVVAWTAHSGLPWLTVQAASTSLDPTAQATVTIMAKPSAGLAPGIYHTTIVFSAGLASLNVPVQVTVTPHH
jgi:hypothetical protein